MNSWIIFLMIGAGATVSCSSDKDDVTKSSYFYYSVNGATCNGEFKLEEEEDPSAFNAVATILPELNNRPETVVLTFTDYTNNRIIYCYLPAKVTGPILMTYDSDFRIGVSDNAHSCSLSTGVENTNQGVSLEVTKFERGSLNIGHGTVQELEAHFEGIMSLENAMGEVEMHTIKGDLYFAGS